MFSETPDTALAMFREFHSESDIERCMDIEVDLVDKKTQVHQYMDQFLRNNGLAFVDLDKVEYAPIRKEMVLVLKEHTALSGRKLAELTGVNREIIRKILSTGM